MIPQDLSVSERVIGAVATDAGTDPLELPQLYESVDPDALDALVSGLSDGEVSFRYAGYAVTVDSNGSVRIDDHLATGDSVDAIAGNVTDAVAGDAPTTERRDLRSNPRSDR